MILTNSGRLTDRLLTLGTKTRDLKKKKGLTANGRKKMNTAKRNEEDSRLDTSVLRL